MQIRVVSIVLASLLAVVANAQTKATPYVITSNGTIIDVVYDVTGFQALAKKKDSPPYVDKLGPKVTASQNTQSLRMAISDIDGTPKTPTILFMHQCLPNGGGIGGGVISYIPRGTRSLTLPNMDVNATQTAGFGIEFVSSDVSFNSFATTSPAEKEAVKVQKKWLPANFRLRLGDMPTARVSKVDSFTIKQNVADFDGDGDLDYGILDDIDITIPTEDLAAYKAWFDAIESGEESVKMLDIEYQDNDGIPFMTVSVPVELNALGFSDLFLGNTASPGREVTVTCRAKGIIAVKAGSGSGSAG
jgi:hypothetical protein